MTFKLDLYVDSATEVDRPYINCFDGANWFSLPLWWETGLSDGVKRITYAENHLYASPGIYEPYFNIEYLVPGIVNLPNSDNWPIRMQSEFILSPFGWSSPDFTAPQNNVTQTETGAILTPSVFDPDGDSLVFSLVPCYGEGYFIPVGTTIDQNTGVITTNPPEPGKYAFCSKIEKIRQGVVLSTSHTDMTIQVDQVMSVNGTNAQAHMGLFPQLITCGENVTARCLGPSELQIHDLLGRIEYRQRVVEGAAIGLSQLATGTHTYTLVNLDDGFRKSGKLVVY